MKNPKIVLSLAAFIPLAACVDNSPPPPIVQPPPPGAQRGYVYQERPKPLVLDQGAAGGVYRQPEIGFDDAPIVNQRPPEQRRYVETYNAVGKPRVIIFVNRTLEGHIVPVNTNDPILSVEERRETNRAVDIERRETQQRDNGWRVDQRDRVDRFKTDGPATVTERVEIYLKPGQYDEIQARALDYEAVENVLTDWLGANGEVTLISPIAARQRLSDKEVAELQSGRPQMLGEIAAKLNADVLIQVQARVTRQTPEGLHVRVIAEALNVKGGQSIGRAFVDVPPPLQKTTINNYTRFLARKLMVGLTDSWTVLQQSVPPAGGAGAAPGRDPVPAPTPQRTPVLPPAPVDPVPAPRDPAPQDPAPRQTSAPRDPAPSRDPEPTVPANNGGPMMPQ